MPLLFSLLFQEAPTVVGLVERIFHHVPKSGPTKKLPAALGILTSTLNNAVPDHGVPNDLLTEIVTAIINAEAAKLPKG